MKEKKTINFIFRKRRGIKKNRKGEREGGGSTNVFIKKIFFCLKLILLVFLNRFNVIILKLNFKK
jgi:hypothetical protein